MGTQTHLQDLHDDLLTGRSSPGDIDISRADFLKDVRRVKRLTQLGVYASIFAALALFRLVLAAYPLNFLAGAAISLIIATAAIEGAFAEMFRLRKRSAYPGAVALHLGAQPTFDAASQAMVAIMKELLRVKSSFFAVREESGYLNLIVLNDLSRADADRYLRAGATCVQRALTSGKPVALHPADPPVAPGKQIVFVPIRSFQSVLGMMGLLGDASNADLRDKELLASLGVAVGVSLESLRQRDELRTLAAVDDLTKVYNRRYFFDQLDREIAAARRHNVPVSILILDLDGLKSLNDNFGHGLGDEALRTLAERLVRHSRTSDMVARLGGDEFAVILPRADYVGAAEIAQRLQVSVERDALAAVPDLEIRIAVSCGFASFPEDAEDAAQLLRQADGRMYAAKAARIRGRPK